MNWECITLKSEELVHKYKKNPQCWQTVKQQIWIMTEGKSFKCILDILSYNSGPSLIAIPFSKITISKFWPGLKGNNIIRVYCIYNSEGVYWEKSLPFENKLHILQAQ